MTNFKGKTIEGWKLTAALRYLAIDFKTKQAKCEAFFKMFDPDSLYDRDQNVLEIQARGCQRTVGAIRRQLSQQRKGVGIFFATVA